MMQKMRERTQGIIAGIIVFLVCLTFALWGIQNYTKSSGDQLVVATVNGSKITQQLLQGQYEKLKQYYLSRLSGDFSFDQQKQAELRKMALQQLIRGTVVLKSAEKMGFFVGSNQLGMLISSFPDFQDKGEFSPEKFQLFLQQTGSSEKNFFAELKNSVISHQLEEGIVASEFMLPSELDRALRLYTQRRDFSYLLLEPKSFVAEVKLNEELQYKYYQQHQNEFLTPEQLSIEYVQLTSDLLAKKIQPTLAQLQQFYTDNSQFFSSKNNIPPFTKIVDQVKSKYIKQKLVLMFADLTDKLTDLTYTNSDSLQPAATALGLTIKSTELFSNQPKKTLTGLLANPKIIKAAFSEGVLKQGYNSNVIELDPGNVVVLRIKEHLPEAVIPFAKVKDTIRVKLLAELCKQKAAIFGEQLFNTLAAGKDIAEMINKYHLTWHAMSKVARNAKTVDQAILQTAFTMGEFTQAAKDAGKSAAQVKIRLADLGEHGFALVRLDAIYPGNPQDLKAAERSSVQKMLDMLLGRFSYAILVEEMMGKAKVAIKDETVDSEK